MKYIQEMTEDAGTQRARLAHGRVASTVAPGHRKASAFWSRTKRLFARFDNNPWLLLGMTVGIATLMIIWWIVSDQWAVRARLHVPDLAESGQPDATDARGIEKLEEQLTGLNDRVEMLADSITYLESKLIRAHVITDSIITAEQKLAPSNSPKQPVTAETAQVVEKLSPSDSGSTTGKSPVRQPTRSRLPEASAAPGTDSAPVKQSSFGSFVQDATSTVAVTEPQQPVSGKQAVINLGEGPWVINLTSSPSKAEADRFAAKVQSRGIETQQQQVTVKGTQYWRVQTIGFSTVDEAQAYAGNIRAKLGLKDVWITTR